MCPQFDLIKGIHEGKEDCLFLSVYVPEGCSKESPCPVMQWIYGGAWVIGSNYEAGDYDGTNLARNHKVVVVAGNYRLDVLGWLSLQELADEDKEGAYGNYGLQDQTAALNWTQRNIQEFGGNPNNVTIFGESAGGFSVCQHLVRPTSNHLFSQAIVESGDCDGPWLIVEGAQAKTFGAGYANAVGCMHTGEPVTECLRRLPLRDLMEPYITWLCQLGHHGPNDIWCDKPNSSKIHHQHIAHGSSSDRSLSASASKQWPSILPPFAPIAGWTAVIDGTQKGLPDNPLYLMQVGTFKIV
jgi:carboxylesterase type B